MRYDEIAMRPKKIIVVLFLPLFLSSFLCSQTLAEIAAKERERRASLKDKKARVVTNADLVKLKKKPALEVPATEEPPVKEEQAVPPPAPPAPAQESQPEPSLGKPAPEEKSRGTLQELQQNWEKAKEYVELLTLKMGALWQQYNSLDAPSSKEAVQLAISETFIKLENAQEEEAKARQALEKFLGQAKKETLPQIWIK